MLGQDAMKIPLGFIVYPHSAVRHSPLSPGLLQWANHALRCRILFNPFTNENGPLGHCSLYLPLFLTLPWPDLEQKENCSLPSAPSLPPATVTVCFSPPLSLSPL